MNAAAILAAIKATLTAFAEERGTLTFLTGDDAYEANAALAARLATALADAATE